jgi:hypothetical protein
MVRSGSESALGVLPGLLLLGATALSFGCSPAPPLSRIEEQVFHRSCAFATCHAAAGTPAAGLSLGGATFDALVNAKSTLASSWLRVVPGDPDSSLLFDKLASDKPKFGQRMPPAQALDATEIEMIRSWIAAGAQNN